MNKKLLSFFISAALGVSGAPAWAVPLNQAEDSSASVTATEDDDSSLWWWLGGGAGAAAAVALAVGGGGGGGGGDDHDDFDDYDDYVEHYLEYGVWPQGTPQWVINKWNGSQGGPGNAVVNGTEVYFSKQPQDAVTGISSFTYAADNGRLVIDKDTVFDGRNKRAVVVTGKSVKVDILDGTTTTARRDATSILAKGGDVSFDIAGKLIADGDDATVVDIEGHNSRVTLQKTGSVLSTNSADGVEISGQNTRVDILGTVSVTGTDSTGIDIEGNNASLNIGKDARLSVQSSGNAWGEERESVLFDVEGDNLSIVQASQDFSVGQYGTGINAEAENGGKILQTGRMTIAGTGATGISIESEGAIKGVQAINQGELLVKNGGTGMKASGRNAVLINSGNIRVQNGGTALDVRKGAMAVNQGTIELSGVGSTAMRATGTGSRIINDTSGVIRLEGQGSTPFATLAGGVVYNNGRIYANGVDVTGQYVIGTSSQSGAGVLYTNNNSVSGARIDTAFTRHTDERIVHFDDVIVGTGLRDEDKITSTSVVWSAHAEKDDNGNVDVVMAKKNYDSVISDTSLTADAQALEKGYKGNALFASLNQNSSHALDEAIRQISGRNSGMSNLQVRRLDNRFRQALSDEIRSPSGAGFNVISRYTPQGELGSGSKFDMVTLSQKFTDGPTSYSVSYGIADLRNSTNDSPDGITGGYSQFFSVGWQYDAGAWRWENQLDAAFHALDTSRKIVYDGVNRQANSARKQQNFTLTSKMSRPWIAEEQLHVTPYLGVKARYNHVSSVTEHGAGEWNLSLSKQKQEVLEPLAGVTVNWKAADKANLYLTAEGGVPVISRVNNGYAQLAGAPAVRFDKTADANTDFNSLIKAGAQWRGDNGSLFLNAWHWQEDGNRDKGLQMNVNYYF